eukprot:s811_g13.t1
MDEVLCQRSAPSSSASLLLAQQKALACDLERRLCSAQARLSAVRGRSDDGRLEESLRQEFLRQSEMAEVLLRSEQTAAAQAAAATADCRRLRDELAEVSREAGAAPDEIAQLQQELLQATASAHQWGEELQEVLRLRPSLESRLTKEEVASEQAAHLEARKLLEERGSGLCKLRAMAQCHLEDLQGSAGLSTMPAVSISKPFQPQLEKFCRTEPLSLEELVEVKALLSSKGTLDYSRAKCKDARGKPTGPFSASAANAKGFLELILVLDIDDTKWYNHKQNDALGYFLWARTQLALAGKMPLTGDHLKLCAQLFDFLRTIECWEDLDAGHWEEHSAQHASSLGPVLAAVRSFKKVMAANPGWIFPGKSDTLEVLEKSLAASLKQILPNEVVKPRANAKDADGALIFLCYPLEVVDDAMGALILQQMEKITGHIAVCRYRKDSY